MRHSIRKEKKSFTIVDIGEHIIVKNLSLIIELLLCQSNSDRFIIRASFYVKYGCMSEHNISRPPHRVYIYDDVIFRVTIQ